MGRASKNKKMPDPPPYALRPGAPDIPQPVQLLGSPSKHLKRRTMIKDLVGAVRTSSYELPGQKHVFGKANFQDSENAGDCMSKWVASNPSKSKEQERSFIKTNKSALKGGYITAAQQREYAQAHPDIKFPPRKSMIGVVAKVPYQGPYGVPSDNPADGGQVRGLIEADFTSFAHTGDNYPDLAHKKKKGAIPNPRPTRASSGHDKRNKAAGDEGKAPFKMKKFLAIEAKVSSNA